MFPIVWVDAPADLLIGALSTMKNKNGDILIEDFFDNIRPINQEERGLLNKIEGSFDEDRWKKSWGIRKLKDGLENKHWEKMLMAPTLNFEGIQIGFWGKPYRIGERLFERSYTKLPFKVKARICIRAVPDMNPEEIRLKIKRHLDKHGYSEVTVRRKTLNSNEPGETLPWRISIKEKIAQAAIKTAMKHNRKVIIHPSAEYSSGLYLFTGPPLNLPGLGFGLGYSNNAHTQNEFIWYEGIRECEKGMVTLYHEFAKTK
jgi:acetylornithine deacetylase/succinyl-diaminopimelate desuccinylase-like protein